MTRPIKLRTWEAAQPHWLAWRPEADVDEAHALIFEACDAGAPWASCGPAALAALLGRPLADIRHAFPAQQPGKTWTNYAMMDRALKTLGIARDVTPDALSLDGGKAWPRHGLVLVQFRGSWDAMPVHHAAQLQRTHWIAVAPPHTAIDSSRRMLDVGAFDVNLVGELFAPGGWVRRSTWEANVVPVLAQSYGKRATGAWWVRAGFEVDVPCRPI